MNDLLNAKIVADVSAAIAEARLLGDVDHKGLRGRFREIVIEKLVKPFLPPRIKVGTGVIIDSQNGQSPESDIVIYDPEILPPVLYSFRDGIFPIESVLYVIEIKSRLTATELEKTVGNFRVIRGLTISPGIYSDGGKPTEHRVTSPVTALLGFSSDISEKGEFERLKEKDANWRNEPAVQSLCVIGKGHWSFSGKWNKADVTNGIGEVVAFVATVSSSVNDISDSRRNPRMNSYFSHKYVPLP